MDLSTIQMHLNNFVHTWEGWKNVIEGIHTVLGYNWAALKEVPGDLSSLSSASK